MVTAIKLWAPPSPTPANLCTHLPHKIRERERLPCPYPDSKLPPANKSKEKEDTIQTIN
jgi:hypothetical protein